jgi:hypothetical protein
MRHGLVLAALLLPLSGCYVAPQSPTYAQPGYAVQQPGYPQPGYAPGPDDSDDNVYPGYSYNDGAPSLYVDGAVMPLVLFGGAWGYYDGGHNWHRAPDAVNRRLEQRRASGATFRPGGGGGGFQPGRPAPGGDPYRGQSSFRPAEPGRPAPGGNPYQGQSSFRPADPGRPAPPSGGQGGFHPAAAPAAAPRPAAPPPREEHRRDCPPGQRC